jgi:YebC/PmpR family DNA-binding regulatory protein
MAGHSHAANVARRKGAVDAQRAKAFNRCARAIQSAVRQGGGDPDANLKLRYAIEKARAANMPKDNIERVIKRALGEGAGSIEELVYEGYAPGGVALMVSCLTDNRNRTAADIKHVFEKRGGNLGAPGSVGFLFEFRSILVIETGGRSEEALIELALEAGAEDVAYEAEVSSLYGAPADFLAIKGALEKHGVKFLSAEIGYRPISTVPLASKDDAAKVLALVSALEDNEDVQSVFSNYDMPTEWFDELSASA